MSKRRNLKKEKAQRNKAYARKFRKNTNYKHKNGGFSRRSYNNGNNVGENEDSDKTQKGERAVEAR